MATTPSPLNEMKVNLVTLSFRGNLEKAFLEDYFQKSLRHVRLALLIAIFFYGIFGILDAWLVPGVKQTLWLIRYAIFLPLVSATFLFSFSRHFKRYMQASIATVVLVAGLGIIAMILIAPYPGNYSYYAGLILVFIYGYTFFKLRFIWATLAGWTIVIAYEIAALWFSHTPIPILINNNFFFLSGNIIGMFACYSIEFYSRRDFMRARLLEAEREKVNTANLELEKRVEDRTRQLTKSNRELRQEIEERKQAENTLRESRERYRSIIEGIEEGYFELDLGGNMTFVNDSMSKISGYSQEELLGMNNRDYTTPETAKRMYQIFNEIYRTRNPQEIIDYEITKKDGSSGVVEISASMMRDSSDQPVGFRGIARDVTERKQTEQELRKSKEAAEAANRTKSEFLSNMNHELRTPLNHIMGFTELVLDKNLGGLNKNQEECLNHVLQSSKHLLSVIDDIIDVSRLEAGELELQRSQIDLKDLLSRSLVMIKEKAVKHGIKVSIDTDDVPETIKADQRKFKQIIYNLLSNAVKFTPSGGEVCLRARTVDCIVRPGLRREDPEDLWIVVDRIEGHEITNKKTKKCVEFSTSDTGIGIALEDQERIFKLFEQVDGSASRRYQGIGSGLFLTKRLVELHGGKIWVESKGEGTGSTFRFIIPG